MELRKDPVTQNWVIQEDGEGPWPRFAACPLCPGQEALSPQTIYSHWNGKGRWQVRVTPHLRPLYRIEGDAERRAEGIYDKMRGLGAHEVVVESPNHDASLSHLSDEDVAQVLRAYVSRITDLRKTAVSVTLPSSVTREPWRDRIWSTHTHRLQLLLSSPEG